MIKKSNEQWCGVGHCFEWVIVCMVPITFNLKSMDKSLPMEKAILSELSYQILKKLHFWS